MSEFIHKVEDSAEDALHVVEDRFRHPSHLKRDFKRAGKNVYHAGEDAYDAGRHVASYTKDAVKHPDHIIRDIR